MGTGGLADDSSRLGGIIIRRTASARGGSFGGTATPHATAPPLFSGFFRPSAAERGQGAGLDRGGRSGSCLIESKRSSKWSARQQGPSAISRCIQPKRATKGHYQSKKMADGYGLCGTNFGIEAPSPFDIMQRHAKLRLFSFFACANISLHTPIAALP
jgi:hypothetical protein